VEDQAARDVTARTWRTMERTVKQAGRSLARAFDRLAPHASKLGAAWRKTLKLYEPCREYAAPLSGMHLPARLRDLKSGNPRAHREESERVGMELARRGVPAECASAAVSLFVDSTLPFLLAGDSTRVQWSRALARWASGYQFFLLSGYARHAAAEREALEQRVALAERRMHTFSVELANDYEKERRRLAQDLHDEIGHDLIVLKLYTQVISLDLKKGDLGQVRRKLRESVSLIKHALAGVRSLTFDLGPAVWDKQGFIPAVRTYVRQFAARTGIHVRFDARRLLVMLPPSYQTTLYMVLQGALSNVAAHANAKKVRIVMASRTGAVSMRVEDDGRGFDVASKLRKAPHSYGLRAMSDRIRILGGTIDFTSEPARRGVRRRGTVIEFKIPFGDETDS
jgi:signal transduction histidine kinase